VAILLDISTLFEKVVISARILNPVCQPRQNELGLLSSTALDTHEIQGKLSIEHLKTRISGLEANRHALQLQFDDLQRKINESAARDFSAEILERTLQDFRSAFPARTPPGQTEALQCVLKSVAVHPHKLDLEIFELEEFLPGSQNRKEWLPGLDSN